MCQTVVLTDGTWVQAVWEMAHLGWPVTEEDVGFPFSELEQSDCLCNINVTQILDRHGVPYEVDPAGFIELKGGCSDASP